jgi:hypothetical protein
VASPSSGAVRSTRLTRSSISPKTIAPMANANTIVEKSMRATSSTIVDDGQSTWPQCSGERAQNLLNESACHPEAATTKDPLLVASV